MKISEVAVRRGVTFSMIFLLIVGFGLFSLSRLKLDLYPDITLPSVVVITSYTGASPEDIETLVTRPIEGAVASAKDAEEINSTSKQGYSMVEVRFNWGKDMDVAETDVRRKLELIRQMMPQDADDPVVFAFDPSLQPILLWTVSGPYGLDELRRIAENELQPQVERLPGIAAAEVSGGLERQIQVRLNPTKITAFGLDVNQVVGMVYRENLQVPGGGLQQGSLDFTIQTEGKYRTVEEIGEVVVGVKNTDQGPIPLRLREVAEVKDDYYESTRVLEVNGNPAVMMMARKQSGANTVRAAEAVVNALPDLQRSAAADLEFQVVFNQADYINSSLANLSSTGLLGVAITFTVLLVFLRNLRGAVIVASAIPISLIATFGAMDQANMTLNTISMAGLALAVGMLVDNSIVVLENIFRLREEGKNAWDAAIEGASSVGTAVMASTLTTVSVFVPVLFVPGIAGVLFKDMSLTICFSLAVSLFVAITFIPLSTSRLFGSGKAARLFVQKREQSEKSGIYRLIRRYGKGLWWILGNRKVVVLVLVAAIGIASGLATTLPTEFVAEQDQSMVYVQFETAMGNNIDETYGIAKEIEKVIADTIPASDRRMIALDAGVGSGMMAMFSKGVHAGQFRVPLVPMEKRKVSQAQYEDMLRDRLKAVPGVKITVAPPMNLMGGAGDVEVELRGYNLEISRKVGLELMEKLKALPEVADVTYSMEDQKPEVRVEFDRLKMGALGLSTADVGNAISTYFMGRLAGRFADAGDEYDIMVRFAKEHRLDVEELRKMPIATPGGQSVPLANIAHIDTGLGPVGITRSDQERVTTLTVYLRDTFIDSKGAENQKDLGSAITTIDDTIKSYSMPEGFSYSIGGSAEDFMESFQYLGLAFLVSVVAVYMVMAAQFESFRQPFIIMFAVPLGLIGVVLMFVLTRSIVGISALVGVIMLVGIAVNNGIVMVDAANQLRDQGQDRFEAIHNAAMMRLRPILMTSSATIMSMVPLALEIGEGAATWSGMARAVIGGLIASTLLTLFVIPVMYTAFSGKDHMKAKERITQA